MSDIPFFFPRNIYLTGFMGCGKSYAASYFRSLFLAPVTDTDEEIARREGKSISEIFSIYGERRFRELESSALEQAARKCGFIVSCGGGIVLRAKNVALMKKSGTIVYLKASPKTICARLKDDGKRPLLDGCLNEARIRRLMEERRGAYEEAADMTVITDGRSAEDICEEIMIGLGRRLRSDV